ncbi:MAG: hypothetical protein RL272_25 [Candidatus Parcubacteria bacterium]|jgi:hypothetical protein
MTTAAALNYHARMFARGAAPTLFFIACLAVAAASETLSFVAAFGGVSGYAVLTAWTVAHARHPAVAVTGASLAAGVVAAGIALDSWAALPIFWLVLAAACGVHVALRLLERRGALLQALGAIAGAAGGMLLGIMPSLRNTTAVGFLCLTALAGLTVFRLVRGRPAEA